MNTIDWIVTKSSGGDFGDIGKRRHSMAGFTQLEKGMRDMHILEIQQQQQYQQHLEQQQQQQQQTQQEVPYETINDYFENTDHRTKAWYINDNIIILIYFKGWKRERI